MRPETAEEFHVRVLAVMTSRRYLLAKKLRAAPENEQTWLLGVIAGVEGDLAGLRALVPRTLAGTPEALTVYDHD